MLDLTRRAGGRQGHQFDSSVTLFTNKMMDSYNSTLNISLAMTKCARFLSLGFGIASLLVGSSGAWAQTTTQRVGNYANWPSTGWNIILN